MRSVSTIWFIRCSALLLLFTASASTMSAPPDTNYDEDKVPPYTLPELLVDSAGQRVTTAKDWQSRRRPEIVRLFETHVYGQAPQPPEMEFQLQSQEDNALDGKAIRKEVAIHLVPRSAGVSLHLLLYLPKNDQPAPMFLGLNFGGNHAIHDDPEIALSRAWMRNNEERGITEHRATEASRGHEASRWQVEKVLERGFGVATMYYGDIDPDFDDGFKNGVHALYDPPFGKERTPEAWGSIATWAWGLSRAMDYLETDSDVDAKRVAVIGHSRLGKTAMWAGATDERFAIVISNNSGCGGAALSRRIFGETVAHINRQFPHWFCCNFHRFNNNEGELPVDQHMLIACIAPRPVYVASATEDRWADPRGEFLAASAAAPVYDLLLGEGTAGLPDDMPSPDQSVGDRIGYHLRTGKHDVTAFDWQQYLDFAQRHYQQH